MPPRALIFAAILFVLGLILSHIVSLSAGVCLVLYLVPYLLVGWETLLTSAKRMIHGAVFDETDFIEYLNTVLYPDKPSKKLKTSLPSYVKRLKQNLV